MPAASPVTVSVREARWRDAGALVALARAVAGEPHGWLLSRPEAWSLRGERRFLRYCARTGDAAVLVGLIDGRVVGRLTVVRDPHSASHHVASLGLMVDASARRRGVASALLAAVEAWAAGHGVSRLELQVLPGNDAALRLYERAGYEQEAVRRLHVVREGALEDAIGMAKLLDPPDGTLAGR